MRDIQELLYHIAGGVKTGDEVETLTNQMDPILYGCPVCGNLFETEFGATECRDQPFDTGGLKVGDIVVVPGRWRSPGAQLEDDWVAFEIPMVKGTDSHFDSVRRRVPYYVVTAVHGEPRDPHRCLVTLATLIHGHLDIGWNPATGQGHCAMFRIDGGKHCDIHSTWIDKIGDLLDCKPSSDMLEEAARLSRIGISTRNLL
jgi:hypothetical protein